MAKTYIGPGEILDWTNGTGSAVSSGDVVQVGIRTYGVALADIASTAVGSVQIQGVFKLGKTTSQTWSEGDALYWDSSTEKATNVPAQLAFIGFATEDAASAATTGRIALAPFSQDPGGIRVLDLAGATATPVAIAATAFLGGGVMINGDTTTALEVDLPGVADIGTGKLLGWYVSAGANALTVDPDAADNFDGGSDGDADTDADAVGDHKQAVSVAAGWITTLSVIA